MGFDPREWGVEGSPAPPRRDVRDSSDKDGCLDWFMAPIVLVVVVLLACTGGPPQQDKDPDCVGARNRPAPCPTEWK